MYNFDKELKLLLPFNVISLFLAWSFSEVGIK